MEIPEPEIKIEFFNCENDPNDDAVTKFKCGEIMFCQNKGGDAQICYNLRCLHCNLTFSYLPEFIGHFNEIYPLISILKDEESVDTAVPAVPDKISRSSELIIVDESLPLNTIVVQPKKPKASTKRNRNKSSKLNESDTSSKTTEIMTTADEQIKNNIIPRVNKQHNLIPRSRECFICKKVYKNPDSLRKHLKHLHTEKTFPCSFCDKKSATIHRHRAHEKTHNKTYDFMCNYCAKKFDRSKELDEHIRIHTGEKPFKCRYCTKEFTIKGNLVRHLRIHTGEKPFKCAHCDKAFSCHQGLKQHKKYNHKESSKASEKNEESGF